MSRFPTADKKFGQHFLHSPHVVQAITQDIPADCDAIIEVGPGPAVLTPKLTAHGLPVYAFEMDKRFTELLTDVVGSERLFLGDALEVDWTKFLTERGHQKAWLVSNLPYNVSVPLTLAFMQAPRIARMTLMYQKEVAEKFLPRSGKNTMSSLAALAGVFFKTSRVVDVPPGAFQPPPKVMSQVIRFDRLPVASVPLADWSAFEEFLRVVFANRRKQMKGLLKDRIPENALLEFFRAHELPEGIRAEAIELNHLLALWQLDQRQRMV